MPGTRLTPPSGPGDHVDGAADAPLELVVYGDFQCPYCAAAQSILRRVRERLGDRLRVVFRHMPMPELHPLAPKASEAAEAAVARGAFWPMHDRMYAARGRLAVEDLVRYASELRLDAERVRGELAEGVHEPRVARDFASGLASGVTGTPAFFVNGEHHEGAFDASSLVAALESTCADGPERDGA